jgi:hypothetical protein
MARRTFIGNINRKVKDPNLVSALSGHKEGSKAFQRYRDIDEEMKRDLVKLLDLFNTSLIAMEKRHPVSQRSLDLKGIFS